MTIASAQIEIKVWRVVVIDVSPDDRAEVRRLLLKGSKRRYRLDEAESGAVGVRAILDAGDLPDCVVLNYNLPDMDAVEVLAALARPDGLTVCPVVVLTETVGCEQSAAVLRAGAQDYLGRGWMTPESLTRAVENASERWAMAREMQNRDTALREINQQLQMSLNVGRAVAFTWDIPTNEVRRLHGIASYFDATDKPATFEEILVKVHPDDRNAFERRVQWAIERPGREYANDYRVVGLDGSVRWISDTGQVKFSVDEKPLRLVGLATDITDRKQAGEARDESDRNYRALAAASSEIAYRMSADWSTMLPLDGRQLVASSDQPLADWAWLDENLPPDEHPRVRHAISEAIARKTLFELEHRVRRPDRSIGWTLSRAVPILDENEAVIAWFGAASDITERKQAEEALRKSESRLRQVFESNVTGMIRWDLDRSLILDANAAFFRMTGYSREDLTNGVLNFRALTPPEWTDRNEVGIETLRTDGVASPYEKEYFRKDGSRVPLIIAGTRFEDSPSEGMSFLIDITERKQAEMALRVSEVRYRRLFESAKDGILILDAHAATIIDVNQFMVDLLGYLQDEFVGKELWQIGLFKDVEASKGAMQELQEKGYIRYEDLPLETKAGRRINVEFVSNVYAENGEAVIQCNIRDITNRRETEQALRKALIYTDDIIATLREPFLVLDSNLRVQTANRSFYDSFHVSKGETESQFVYDLGNGQWDIPALRTLLDRVLSRNESVHDFEVEHTFPALGRKTMLLNARPFPPDSKHPELILLAVEDVSAVRERADELAAANTRKDEFLATLAHELRNPLAPIRNGLQIMKMAGSDAAAVEESRAMMERQVEQMTHLIDDLMDVSRINQGKIQLQKTRMPLRDAVRNAVDTSRPLIDAQGHELVVTLPPEPVYIDGDMTRLSQVFANLLNNSAKYTDRGGRIRLAVERQGSDAVVSVADNGVGIPANMMARVFDMFAQIGGSLEKAQGGLGIGLNIVKRLVEMHGGSIGAESDGPGMGSAFTVRLPLELSDTKETSDNPSTDEQAKPAACRRILVVDDNRDGAFTLAMMLRLMGNETQTAHDGLEAVTVSEAFKPDVILMDIGMPKLNGYDACRRIREQPWANNIVLIALTGWGQEKDRQKSKDAGFNGHLVKPVDHAALIKLLANS